MEYSCAYNKYEEYFQDIFEVVNNQECDCIICRDYNYIHETKHDGIYVYRNDGLDFSRE